MSNLTWVSHAFSGIPMRTFVFCILCFMSQFTITPLVARGQCPPGWQPGESLPGLDGVVNAMIVLANGDLVVGGSFTAAGTVKANSVARWSTGQWSPLGAGLVNGEVCSLVEMPDGTIVAGGRFSTDITRQPVLLARWNGVNWQNLDADVVVDSTPANRVRAMSVLPGGELVIGGDAFDLLDDSGVILARKSAAGWRSLAYGSGSIRAILPLPTSDLVVGGNFTMNDPVSGAVLASNLARLAGENWSQLGPVLNSQVNALAIDANGAIVAGGVFTSAGPVELSGLALLGAAGWMPINTSPEGTVGALVKLSSGKVAAMGRMPRPGSVFSTRLALWDGTTLQDVPGGMYAAGVNAGAELADGQIIIGSAFAQIGGVRALGIAAWNGTEWSSLGQGFGTAVRAMKVGRDGKVLIGGSHPPYSPWVIAPARVALWNGRVLSEFPPLTGSLVALDRRGNGEIIVGGELRNLADQPEGSLSRLVARWDGTTWRMMGNLDGNLRDILVTRNDEVLIAGDFFSRNGDEVTETPGIVARWNGVSWDSLGSLRTGSAAKLIERPDGTILAVGHFQVTPGSAVGANSIAEWDGSTWSYSAPPSNGAFFDAALLPNGDVVVGGVFSEAGEVPALNIAKWNGTSWSALGSGSRDWVYAVGALPNGDILSTGFFRTDATFAISPLARWNGTRWTNMGFGGNRPIQSLATLPNGDFLAGGLFSGTVPGPVSAGLAHYSFGRSALVIDTQPRPAIACAGSGARMTVKLSDGVGATYQWRKDDVPLSRTSNSSANSSTLVIRDVNFTDAGIYDCVITSPCGSIVSMAAELSVPLGCNLADVAGQGSACPDGTLTADDIITFLGWYFAGNSRADVAGANQSTPPDGTTSADDIIVFVSSFFAGCD